MLFDKSPNDEDYMHIALALVHKDMYASQQEFDDCVLMYKQRDEWYKQWEKRCTDLFNTID